MDTFTSGSQLPSLRQQSSTRSQLSNQPSFLSRSRRSTSSLLSIGSDLQSTGSNSKNRRPFKPISYFRERRVQATQETYHHFQRVMRTHKAALTALIDEKSQITAAMKRERAHIDALNQENEAREASIRETLAILRSSTSGKRIEGQPPSIAQLRLISNAILKEGLRFKQLSEQPKRIERETIGAENLAEEKSPLELNKTLPGATNDDQNDDSMDYQRSRLSNLVFKKEDAKMRLETIMSNRDMLTRVIFDHKTALEALKLKQKALTEEAVNLEKSFHENLEEIAKTLGELTWKNAMVQACNDIAFLPKTT
ncbi:hypothetical protein TRFO_11098 [Tritrichomonas foetus]|uniref:Uncharacterized protein n=1 Tax=Tritrichomonas foetus TaxID=1144522 RepID=A0A1J4J5E2_9EUKA|nr:hypothetical protein TRFO_11098 [Tritrichomonas foetus]|eukprot:OHS94478.1 hypothetical protein TRFO_11098 [Tritrichomonas foetus]